MLVNHRHKFLFVHIPKTAGGAVRAFNRKRLARWYGKGWKEIGEAHSPLTREIATRYADYLKFAILRNPWKIIASSYRFATQGISQNKKTGQTRQRDITMLQWLTELKPHHRSDPFPWPFPCQMDYVSDANGLLVDQICRHEHLAADMRAVLGRLGISYHAEDWEQPTRHYYGQYNWKDYFVDPEVRAQVQKLCAKDFAYHPWELDSVGVSVSKTSEKRGADIPAAAQSTSIDDFEDLPGLNFSPD